MVSWIQFIKFRGLFGFPATEFALRLVLSLCITLLVCLVLSAYLVVCLAVLGIRERGIFELRVTAKWGTRGSQFGAWL